MSSGNSSAKPKPPQSEWALDDDDPESFLRREEAKAKSRKARRPKKKADTSYCKVPYEVGMRLARQSRDPRMLVLLEIIHRAWKESSAIVLLPNTNLRASRKLKSQALDHLQAEGLITWQARKGKSPQITLKGVLRDLFDF